MELKDTIGMMTSPDYKERFKAEYHQLLIRAEKLAGMLERWRDGSLDFEPSCPFALLNAQSHLMASYLSILEQRAQIEGIEL